MSGKWLIKYLAVIIICFLMAAFSIVGMCPSASAAVVAQTPIPEKTTDKKDSTDNATKPTDDKGVGNEEEIKTPTTPAAIIGQQIQQIITGGESVPEIVVPQETFGTRTLSLLITIFDVAHNETVSFMEHLYDFSKIDDWWQQQQNTPALVKTWRAIADHSVSAIGLALIAWWLVDLMLFVLRRRITKWHPQTLLARFKALSLWLLLALIPVTVFVGVAFAILGRSAPPEAVAPVILPVIYAFAAWRLLRIMSLFLFAPRRAALRLVPIADSQAGYLVRWVTWLGAVMISGHFGSEIARAIKIPEVSIATFNAVVWLIAIVMIIIVIVQKHSYVAALIAGTPKGVGDENAENAPIIPLWIGLRGLLAQTWHWMAIAYLVIGYIVTASGGGEGLALMQRGTVLTIVVLSVAWLIAYMVERFLGRSEHHTGGTIHTSAAGATQLYRPVFRWLLRLALWAGMGIAIAAAWGADVATILTSPWGQRITGSAFSISATLVTVVILYEAIQSLIERSLNKRDAAGQVVATNTRARTILPMVRSVAVVVLSIIVGMVTLSELGINTGPLMAGAGIIGVALGFGSQTLVKDFLTGLFNLMENNFAVGDTVKIGDNSGTVEGMSLRTVRLRDISGAVHIVPFSEINRIINYSRDYSYAVMDLGVGYESNLEQVLSVIRTTGEEMMNNIEVGHLILEPISVMGVESFADSAIIVRCRIKTIAGKNSEVRRNFLLKIKTAFDRAGINIPYPTVMQLNK